MLVPSRCLLVLKLCHNLSHWQSAFQMGSRRMEIAKSLKLWKTYRSMLKGSFRKDRPSRRNSAEISARCRRVGIESSVVADLKRLTAEPGRVGTIRVIKKMVRSVERFRVSESWIGGSYVSCIDGLRQWSACRLS